MTIFSLALKSLLDRKVSVLFAMLAMTLSIFVLLCVEDIRHQVKQNFSNTISGVDLVVGARTGSLNLLLYSVFRIGAPSNTIHWHTYQEIASHQSVKWAIPVSLGDSHKGYRVLGTSPDYFQYFSYGEQHRLHFTSGSVFAEIFDVVLGAEVAQRLGYRIGDQLTLAHGLAATSFTVHEAYPFTVIGILAPTGTPVDQTVHVSLQGIEAIHTDPGQEENGHNHTHDHEPVPAQGNQPHPETAQQPVPEPPDGHDHDPDPDPDPDHEHDHEHDHESVPDQGHQPKPVPEHLDGHDHQLGIVGLDRADLQPDSITAIFLGLNSKLAVFEVQRAINQYTAEPLLAILPGVALSELWQMMSVLENSLLLVSALVFVAASLGVSAMLFASIRERRQEIHLLRIIGAPPRFLFLLIEIEALLITLFSCLSASGLLLLCLVFMRDPLLSHFGLYLEINPFTANKLYLMAALLTASALIAAIPSLGGYRQAKASRM